MLLWFLWQFHTFSFLTGSSYSLQLPAQLVWLEVVAREGWGCPGQVTDMTEAHLPWTAGSC